MKFNILVTGGLYSTQSAYSALEFCRAALSSGHSITQVFFSQDAVTQANALSVPLSDEFDAVSAWAEFAHKHSIALTVCVSAAERRGVLNKEQAQEFDKIGFNTHSAFKIVGLGVLHEAALGSDRMVTFK